MDDEQGMDGTLIISATLSAINLLALPPRLFITFQLLAALWLWGCLRAATLTAWRTFSTAAFACWWCTTSVLLLPFTILRVALRCQEMEGKVLMLEKRAEDYATEVWELQDELEAKEEEQLLVAGRMMKILDQRNELKDCLALFVKEMKATTAKQSHAETALMQRDGELQALREEVLSYQSALGDLQSELSTLRKRARTARHQRHWGGAAPGPSIEPAHSLSSTASYAPRAPRPIREENGSIGGGSEEESRSTVRMPREGSDTIEGIVVELSDESMEGCERTRASLREATQEENSDGIVVLRRLKRRSGRHFVEVAGDASFVCFVAALLLGVLAPRKALADVFVLILRSLVAFMSAFLAMSCKTARGSREGDDKSATAACLGLRVLGCWVILLGTLTPSAQLTPRWLKLDSLWLRPLRAIGTPWWL